ncbi:MAG: N-acetyltransferase [Candidatus Bathyarchaeota archaeon]
MNIEPKPPRNYKIRRFTEKDVRQVMDINLNCLPENYSINFYLELYRVYPNTFIVAEHDAKVVGYVMFRIESGFSEINRLRFAKKGHLVSIAILPEHRGKGLGTNIMMVALDESKRYGCSETYLEVRPSNSNAIALYEKLGYSFIKEISSYYFDGENASEMGKKLD